MRLLPAGFVWRYVNVVSDDEFGTRLTPTAVFEPSPGGSVLLAYAVNGTPLTHAAGLVRLIAGGDRRRAQTGQVGRPHRGGVMVSRRLLGLIAKLQKDSDDLLRAGRPEFR